MFHKGLEVLFLWNLFKAIIFLTIMLFLNYYIVYIYIY